MDAGINKLTDAVSFAYWSIISSTNSSIYSTIQKWLFSITKIKKIQEPGFTSKPSEKPYFSCIFTLLLVYLVNRTALSTWLGSLTDNLLKTHCTREWYNTYFRLKTGILNRFKTLILPYSSNMTIYGVSYFSCSSLHNSVSLLRTIMNQLLLGIESISAASYAQ